MFNLKLNEFNIFTTNCSKLEHKEGSTIAQNFFYRAFGG